jgi:hypothetical protein
MMVAHAIGQRHERDLVVMRLGDFVEWLGNVGHAYRRSWTS